MDAVGARGVERLLALGIGALAITLGFFLFVLVPTDTTGDGSIKWADAEVVLTHVGPGVFFALFGAGISIYSIRTQLKLTRGQVTTEAPTAAGQVVRTIEKKEMSYVAGGSRTHDLQSLESTRSRLQIDLGTLAAAVAAVSEAEGASSRLVSDSRRALDNVKDVAMEAVWDADWGDLADFKKWVLDGCAEPPPAAVATAAGFFLGPNVIDAQREV